MFHHRAPSSDIILPLPIKPSKNRSVQAGREGIQLRPWMSPTGPVSLDKQWISATAALAVSENAVPALSSWGSSSCSAAVREVRTHPLPGQNELTRREQEFVDLWWALWERAKWFSDVIRPHTARGDASMPFVCHMLTHTAHVEISTQSYSPQVLLILSPLSSN